MQKQTVSTIIGLALLIGLVSAVIYYSYHHNTKGGTGSQVGSCLLTTNSKVDIYTRASTSSALFGTVTPSEPVHIAGKTKTGWLAFDPGTAQAANVGPFRYRYIAPDGVYTLSGNCTSLPEVVTLPAAACFTMGQSDTPIYSEPLATSQQIGMLKFEDYAPVVAKSEVNGAYFIKIDGTHDTTLSGITDGWIDGLYANFNGDCASFYSGRNES